METKKRFHNMDPQTVRGGYPQRACAQSPGFIRPVDGLPLVRCSRHSNDDRCKAYPSDENCHVSHETIYRSLFIQARGALKKELLQHLRRTRGMRRSRHHTQKTDTHGRILDAVSISERPATVEDRAVPGHWEGDLLFGSSNSQIATLVERQTRYVMLVKVTGKDTETVVNALVKHARKLPQELYKSLTWDRGKEMAGHKHFTLATDIKVYFCDPLKKQN